MRRASVLLTAVGLVWWLAACSGDARDSASSAQPSSAPSPSPSTPPASTAPTAASTSAASPRPAATTPRSTPGRTTAAPTPSSGGDVVGLPFGQRRLTGTVERAGGCTMLLVGDRRWALTGDVAAGLSAGERVTVHGTLAPRPAACGDRDLAQTIAVQRTESA